MKRKICFTFIYLKKAPGELVVFFRKIERSIYCPQTNESTVNCTVVHQFWDLNHQFKALRVGKSQDFGVAVDDFT